MSAGHHWDVLVVGAGPAGIAATVAAASHGARVGLVDDNPAAGGQIWRQGASGHPADTTAARHLQALRDSGATRLAGQRVVSAPEPGCVETWRDGATAPERHHYRSLVLATGARERFLPFPGWTLPGVFGAGGLQALVRGGYDVRGKRVVVAGTGPLLPAVAAHLSQDGAVVAAVYEQAPLRRLVPFALRLWNKPAKLRQAAGLLRQLSGVPYRHGWWPVEALGAGRLKAVVLTNGHKRWTEPCDLLACGFHLLPNTEVAQLLGCRIHEGGVAVDTLQRTTAPQVFAAGEATGVAGVDAALLEGSVAGHAAACADAEARTLAPRAAKEQMFGRALDRAFALRPELRTLCEGQTVVCRCEDVRYGTLAAIARRGEAWTDAKLLTRCGMGPCQGRVCGPALETLFGWRNASVRPPLFPVPLGALASAAPDICTTDVSESTNETHEEAQ